MSNPKPRRFRRRSDRGRGQAMVEFAFVFPLFVILVASVVYLGMMLYENMTVINAAREAARAAAIVSDRTTIPTTAPQTAQSVVGGSPSAINVTVACIAIKTSPSCDFSSATSSKSGDAVKVTVTVHYANPWPIRLTLLGNVLINFPPSFDLTSAVQMVLE